jgi:hypothetical protein
MTTRIHYCTKCQKTITMSDRDACVLQCPCGGKMNNCVVMTDMEYQNFLPIIQKMGFFAWYRQKFGRDAPMVEAVKWTH